VRHFLSESNDWLKATRLPMILLIFGMALTWQSATAQAIVPLTRATHLARISTRIRGRWKITTPEGKMMRTLPLALPASLAFAMPAAAQPYYQAPPVIVTAPSAWQCHRRLCRGRGRIAVRYPRRLLRQLL
jgi:hypothetical protein